MIVRDLLVAKIAAPICNDFDGDLIPVARCPLPNCPFPEGMKCGNVTKEDWLNVMEQEVENG